MCISTFLIFHIYRYRYRFKTPSFLLKIEFGGCRKSDGSGVCREALDEGRPIQDEIVVPSLTSVWLWKRSKHDDSSFPRL